MNIYFSGIGGVGIGPLAEIAFDAGYQVQGSDPEESPTTKRLAERGITINQKQDGAFLQTCHDTTPINWFVYSSALPADHPELVRARALGIKTSKRDEFLALLLQETKLKLIAVAGTHGKTGTTAMLVWAMQQLGVPVSYSVGSTLSFGPGGKYDPRSEYFIYECDEFDRNFLHFHPHLSLVTSIDYDHPDIYPTRQEYLAAFEQFLEQSHASILWQRDGASMHATNSWMLKDDEIIKVALPGAHTRANATLVFKALERLSIPGNHMAAVESFPGADRRFEKIGHNLYSDYGHHPTEIAATLQMARELSEQVVLVYQPHQNVRQHEIRDLYTDCFEKADTVYWLPTYLSREDPNLPILTAEELTKNVTNLESLYTADFDDELWEAVQHARDDDKLVIFMGAGSIDSWLRNQWSTRHLVNVLITNEDGSFLLHKSEDAFTGIEGEATAEDTSNRLAALRTVTEATNLAIEPNQLAYLRMYRQPRQGNAPENFTFFYTLPGIPTDSLKALTDQNYVVVTQEDLLSDQLASPTRIAVADYVKSAQ